MDFEALVGAILGRAERTRYLTVGLILILGAVVCLALITRLPLIMQDGEAVAPSEEGTSALDEVVLGYQLMAVLGFSALLTIGLLMAIEGAGGPVLSRWLPWRPELRSATVFAAASAAALVGTAGAGAILGIAVNETTVTGGGLVISEGVTSPSCMPATVLGSILGLLCLLLACVSGSLAVHRAGGDRRWVRLSRLAVVLSLLSAVSFVVLHVDSVVVMNATLEYSSQSISDSYIIESPYAPADIKIQAKLPDAGRSIVRLDDAVGLLGATVLALALLSLGTVIGVAALALGARTRRAHVAATLPMLALAVGLLGIATGVLVMSLSPSVVQDLTTGMIPVDTRITFDVTLSGGLLLAMASVVGAVIISALFARTMGPSAFKVSLGTEAPPAATGAPSQAPARSVLPVRSVATAVLLFVAIAASWWFVSAAHYDRGDEVQAPRVDIEALDTYSNTVEVRDYLPEGQSTAYSAVLECLCMPPSLEEAGTAIYFIDEVRVTLRWVDEPDTTRVIATWENQPDTFSLGLVDGAGLMSQQGEAANPPDGQGAIELAWGGQGSYVVVAIDWRGPDSYEVNEDWAGSIVTDGDDHWSDLVLATIGMLSAGDATNPRRPLAYTDGGNEFTLEVTLSGHVYIPTGPPQSGQG